MTKEISRRDVVSKGAVSAVDASLGKALDAAQGIGETLERAGGNVRISRRNFLRGGLAALATFGVLEACANPEPKGEPIVEQTPIAREVPTLQPVMVMTPQMEGEVVRTIFIKEPLYSNGRYAGGGVGGGEGTDGKTMEDYVLEFKNEVDFVKNQVDILQRENNIFIGITADDIIIVVDPEKRKAEAVVLAGGRAYLVNKEVNYEPLTEEGGVLLLKNSRVEVMQYGDESKLKNKGTFVTQADQNGDFRPIYNIIKSGSDITGMVARLIIVKTDQSGKIVVGEDGKPVYEGAEENVIALGAFPMVGTGENLLLFKKAVPLEEPKGMRLVEGTLAQADYYALNCKLNNKNGVAVYSPISGLWMENSDPGMVFEAVAPPDSEGPKEYVAWRQIPGYANPGDESPFGNIDPGKTFTVLEERDGWLKIRTPQGGDGWIKEAEGAYGPVGSKPPETQPPEANFPREIVLANGQLEIRNMGRRFGLILSPYAKLSDGTWAQGAEGVNKNKEYVEAMFAQYGGGRRLRIYFYNSYDRFNEIAQGRGIKTGNFYKFGRRVEGVVEYHIGVYESYSTGTDGERVTYEVDFMGIGQFLAGQEGVIVDNAPPKQLPGELEIITYPAKIKIAG